MQQDEEQGLEYDFEGAKILSSNMTSASGGRQEESTLNLEMLENFLTMKNLSSATRCSPGIFSDNGRDCDARERYTGLSALTVTSANPVIETSSRSESAFDNFKS